MEDCKYLKTEDVTPWHNDVFDHPDYKHICEKIGREIIPFIHCKRCKERKEEAYNNERKHGHWMLLDECSNAGVYCSVCHKKVYKTDYANQKIKSKYCPNCGSIMDEEFEVL